MSRQLSQYHFRIRTQLRVVESQGYQAIHGEDLAEQSKVPRELISIYVREDRNDGLDRMPDLISTIPQDGKSAAEIWSAALRINPKPIWWNRSRIFQEPVFLHMTLPRAQSFLARFGKKQVHERKNKSQLVERLRDSSPAIASVLKPAALALRKPIPALPGQSEVKL